MLVHTDPLKKKKKRLRKLQYACITDFSAYPVLTMVRLLFSNDYTQKFAFSGPQNQPTNKTSLFYAMWKKNEWSNALSRILW